MNVYALSLLLVASFLLHIFLMGGLRNLPPIERRVLHPAVWLGWTSLIWLVAEGDVNQERVTLFVAIAGAIGVAVGLWREVVQLCTWTFRFDRVPQSQALSQPLSPPVFSHYDDSGRAVTRGMGPRGRSIRV